MCIVSEYIFALLSAALSCDVALLSLVEELFAMLPPMLAVQADIPIIININKTRQTATTP